VVASSSRVSIHVRGNAILRDYYGVWLGGPVYVPHPYHNAFFNVTVPVYYAP
jgi:hypothetical protein